ncbi:tyrosine-type recombinase/integrase [Exiguobacterium profundum]|uniref:tyrosine-type recombinase/integrase n=1 Tax=Exiguobacterium profundum TaxID=307643 RepID=UPI002AA6653D|nr:tyrosine-type recombinase/integrase [Exiguobacterium profundum]
MFKSRKHGVFAVDESLIVPVSINKVAIQKDTPEIDEALNTVYQQMKISGNRPRTIESYKYVFNQFKATSSIKFVEDISIDSIYHYLDSLNVSANTKLIRLKTLKAVLSKFFDNGWIHEKFWSNIHIKIDKEVKQGAEEADIITLLSLIDQSTFIGFRDATAVRLMYATGIRIRTLGELRERHIDFENLCLNLDGSTLKNHKFLKLPITEEIAMILRVLVQLNNGIRDHFEVENTHVFITQNGHPMNNTKSSNCAVSKQLHKYSKRYNLKNINAHAIRRGFAKNLLKKGASVTLISKALGHSDLAVTTQYLDLDVEEVATDLRNYL